MCGGTSTSSSVITLYHRESNLNVHSYSKVSAILSYIFLLAQWNVAISGIQKQAYLGGAHNPGEFKKFTHT